MLCAQDLPHEMATRDGTIAPDAFISLTELKVGLWMQLGLRISPHCDNFLPFFVAIACGVSCACNHLQPKNGSTNLATQNGNNKIRSILES